MKARNFVTSDGDFVVHFVDSIREEVEVSFILI